MNFWRRYATYAVCVLLSALPLPAEQRATASDEAVSVTVAIEVAPIAQVELPQGGGFRLYIPTRDEGTGPGGPFTPQQAPHLDIAEIPFEVTGNGIVNVDVKPETIIAEAPDGVIGEAMHTEVSGWTLPYRVRLEFPLGNPPNPTAGLGNPGGRNPTQGESYSADTSSGPLSGIVHVIPDVTWGEIASGRFSESGHYTGTVEITVTIEAEQ